MWWKKALIQEVPTWENLILTLTTFTVRAGVPGSHGSPIIKMLKISAFYLDKQKGFVPKKVQHHFRGCYLLNSNSVRGVTNRDLLLLVTMVSHQTVLKWRLWPVILIVYYVQCCRKVWKSRRNSNVVRIICPIWLR